MKMKKNPKKQSEKVSAGNPDTALIRKYHLLMDFWDNIPDVIYFKDKNGKIDFVNNAYARGLKLKPEEIVGKTDFDFFPKKRAERMQKDDQYVLRTGKAIVDKIERATRPDGVDNFVSTTKIPRYNNKGRIVGLIGVTRDVTKRIQLERLRKDKITIEKKFELLEEMNSIKSDFISTASHELRTPLAIVKQLLVLLYDEVAGAINDQQREILVKARHHIERLKNIMDKLFDMSRLERNSLRLRYSLVNLNDLLRDSESFFREFAQEKGVKLRYIFPKKQICVFVDTDRILQVITNLITNAIKFTEQNGKITIEVKVLEFKIRIGVIDTGMGITKADVPKVFQKFVQGSISTMEATKGIGLGLSISKEIVDKHGGEIWIESEVGVGTRCFFTLPRYHTPNILGRKLKAQIDQLLSKNKEVHLMHLVIIDYDELKKRIDIGPQELFRELKNIIDSVSENVLRRDKKRPQILFKDMRKGKFSIIFPDISRKKIAVFSKLVKQGIKSYFVDHAIQNVSIAIGVLSYSSKDQIQKKHLSPKDLKIKEIYIGHEMRREKRISYKTQLEIVFPGKKKRSLTTVDISTCGVCFISPRPLETDVKVNVKIMLLRKKESFEAKAMMMWMAKMKRLPGDKIDKYKTGLEFISVNKKYKDMLAEELKQFYG